MNKVTEKKRQLILVEFHFIISYFKVYSQFRQGGKSVYLFHYFLWKIIVWTTIFTNQGSTAIRFPREKHLLCQLRTHTTHRQTSMLPDSLYVILVQPPSWFMQDCHQTWRCTGTCSFKCSLNYYFHFIFPIENPICFWQFPIYEIVFTPVRVTRLMDLLAWIRSKGNGVIRNRNRNLKPKIFSL